MNVTAKMIPRYLGLGKQHKLLAYGTIWHAKPYQCLSVIKCNSPLLSTCIQQIVNTLNENSQDVSSGPESTKTILKVREKASDVKMFSETIINNPKILLMIGRRLIGQYLPRTDLSPSFLISGTTNEDFQQEGNKIRPSIYCIA